ncbi:outer dense fiber protein 3-like [Selaginella moellendorffii]|uniref:outer dense fiber protein 3-like n=1 Tax=Selaginella moellendorffii TaxID=88036 RepID=UPI000D1C762B|nr:outer dense fiber protein 3-like [Selaginella moellendorffii]|eukprot:XP_024518287.1 outer dense fiber protein 3-like [Selaginella moellendorffii]
MGRKNKDNKNPGPGAYYPDVKPVTPASPAYSISCKPPPPHNDEDNPGPGAYTVEHGNKRFGPAFTIPGRHPSSHEKDEKALMPGPGAYRADCEIIHPRDPAYSMQGRRSSYPKEVLPGPGAYGAGASESGPSFTILAKRESPMSTSAETPGPGAYNAGERPKSSAISFAGKYGRRLEDDSPGPGAYPAASTLTGPSFSMARKRPPREVIETPGPGQYAADAALAYLQHKEPAFSIAGRGRRQVEISGPGPGRHSKSLQETGPGPGAYSPVESYWGGPAYSFTSRKLNRPMRESPGPGEYKASTKKIAESSPAFSIGIKYSSKNFESGPGPGTYNSKSSLGGPAFTLSGRGDDD